MISMLEKLGDRMLTAFVPSISAAAASRAACTFPNCGGCFQCRQRYRACCNGTCGPCGHFDSCCG